MTQQRTKEIILKDKDYARFERLWELGEGGCWLWKNALNAGYGAFSSTVGGKAHIYLAHRVSYTIHVGEIPRGLVIDHLCEVKSCVNPEHLEAVTLEVNVQRGFNRDNIYQCIRGHDKSNYRTTDSGRNYCQECSVARQRAYRLGLSVEEALKATTLLDHVMTKSKPHTKRADKPRKVFMDWSIPQHCLDCLRGMRSKQMPKDSKVLYGGRGRCSKCHKTVLYGERYNVG